MSDRDLEIKLKIDDSQAKQKITEHDARLAASKQKALDHYLATNRAVKETVKDVENLGKKGSQSFLDIAAAGAVAYAGFSKTLGIVRDLTAEIEKAKQKSRELQNTFADDRDKYRELAFIMGRQADNAFVLEQKNFNLKSAMTSAEGLSFRTQFQNAGAQFAGKTMSQAESKQYEQQAASLATALKLQPSEAGDFFGTFSGLKNRTGLGEKASESTLDDARRVISILGRGKGDNPVLINQFAQIASASLSEDEMKGVFQSPEDIATLISVGAEKSDARSGYMLRAATRGMRDFNGDAGPLLARSNVNAKTPFLEGIKNISKPIQDEARASGLKTEDVVRKYFVDEETVNAISTYINKGVEGGLFADREAFAKTLQNGTATSEISAFQGKDEAGIRRQALARKDLGVSEVAAGQSRIDILRQQAEAQNAIDESKSPGMTAIGDWTQSILTGFTMDPREARIQSMMGTMIEKRAKGYGLNIDATSAIGANTPEGMNSEFNRIFDQMSAAGANPLVDALAENTRVVKENNDLMRKQTGGQTVPPALPSVPQAPRR